MRSWKGELGLRFGQLMDRLAAQSDAAGLAGKAAKWEGGDITAKLIVLARDRRAWPGLYKRIAADYVDWPEDPYAYYGEPPAPAPEDPLADPFVPGRERVGRYSASNMVREPKPVSKEDLNESTMPPIEYSYFAPPCGRAFPSDNFRNVLFDAMRTKGEPSKLRILMAVDLLVGAKQLAPDQVFLRDASEVPARYLCAHPDRLAFLALAVAAHGRDRIASRIKDATGLLWTTESCFWQDLSADQRQAAADKNHAEWVRLAEQDWKEPHEKEFAAFLKTIPMPPPKVKPVAAPRGPPDPSDPFRPSGP